MKVCNWVGGTARENFKHEAFGVGLPTPAKGFMDEDVVTGDTDSESFMYEVWGVRPATPKATYMERLP
jgi:hypothetical protein